MNESFGDIWGAVAQVRTEAPALVQGPRRLSWEVFRERSARLAAALGAWAVGPGANVGLCMRNRPEYMEATWAAFSLGATPLNLNYRYTAEELAYVLADGDAAVAICDGAAAGVVSQAARQAGVRLVEVGAAYEQLIAHPPPPLEPPGPHTARRAHCPSGDDLYMIYTGGTTGRPKGVEWRHEDLAGWLSYPAYEAAGLPFPTDAADAARVAEVAALDGDTPVTLLACPLVHGTAFFFALCALELGGLVIMLEGRSLDVDEMWRTVESESVTQMVIVGDAQARPAVEALDRALHAGRPYDTSSLRRVFSSGMCWSAEAKAGLLRHTKATMVDMLGSSEGGPFGIDLVAPGDVPTTARFSITDRAAVLRADGTLVERGSGEVGRLGITDPIPLGYHKDAERSAATFPVYAGRRWSLPGDFATLDADGTIRLLGRGSTCVNTGGEKVWPDEVETVLLAHPSVGDCVVVGVADDRWGEAVVALVALRSAGADLHAWLRPRLAAYKVPKRFVVVEAIQRSAAGKADYAWAIRAAAGG
ncbi:MAG: AMP-binding protein [Acidimicrobiales bacterium]